MDGIGFIAALWLKDALQEGLLPTSRSHTTATLIAEAADRDGRWCYLFQRTLVQRSGGTLSLSTAKRALADLVRAGLLRKLPRTQLRHFFAADLAAGRRRADNLPDVLELLIPASAFTRHDPHLLEEINTVRARLGEEPLTPANRPDLPATATATAGHDDLPRQSTLTGRARPDRPTNPSPTHPCPAHPHPDPPRERPTTEQPDPDPNPAPKAHPVSATQPAPVPRQRQSLIPAPRPTLDPRPTQPPVPAWASALLAPIPDAAFHHPERDRHHLAARLTDLAAQGLNAGELAQALDGWEHTRRPYAALTRRLASPATVRAWNTRTLLHTLPHPRTAPDTNTGTGAGDVFAHRPVFTLDTHGKAARTCPAHPSVRNTPGGTCTLCGALCRTHPDELLHPPTTNSTGENPSDRMLRHLFGPPDTDERFPAPKCADPRCNPDKTSPRYRTVLRRTPDNSDVIAVPCPTCGHTTAPTAA